MSTASLPGGGMVAAARNRQIFYALAILALFTAMWPYNQWLQSVKRDKDLGEATIGQVDTGGFMLKLAMIGGARGVVANALWTQAHEYEKAHEWDKLKNTVDFITKLQPHFLSIWTYQGWNLAYNVSVEWDAPDDKYVWIKKGINFLKDGVAKNQKSPDLVWDTAWTYYHKIGFADEAIILRRLFYDDPDDDRSNFRMDPISRETRSDNFQVAHGWFARAIQKVDDEGASRVQTNMEQAVEYVDKPTQHKGRPGDLGFRTMPAHAQTRYAAALEKQSIRDIPPKFGDIARNEWTRSLREWEEFGVYKWPAFRFEDQMVQIDDVTNPEKLKTLTEEQQYWTDRWGQQTNYRYWKDRALAEREPQGVEARRLFYEGTKAFKAGRFFNATDKDGNEIPGAAEFYKRGLVIWAQLLERHPVFREDDLNKKDTRHILRRYLQALKQGGEKEPEDYPFKQLLEGPQEDYNPDPFDQLEMTRTGAGAPGSPR